MWRRSGDGSAAAVAATRQQKTTGTSGSGWLAQNIFSFGTLRKVGVARRASALVDTGGVGGAGVFGAMATRNRKRGIFSGDFSC